MSHPQPWLATYNLLEEDWHQVPTPPDKTLSDYVREAAEEAPDRTALVFQDQTFNYRWLDEQSNRMANLLKQQGHTAGDVLGIHLPNTPQYVVALVGAARLGLVVTSVSPLLSPPEVQAQCYDAKVNALLTLDAQLEGMGEQPLKEIPGLRTVFVSGLMDMTPAQSQAEPKQDRIGDAVVLGLSKALDEASSQPVSTTVSLDDVLYLQFTGGTTGRSKGAQLTSRNIFVNQLQANVFYRLQQGKETIASAFPFFHIGGLAVLMNALRTASTFLVVLDPRNTEAYCEMMANHPPTVLANVPALFQMLMDTPRFRELDWSQTHLAISGAAPFAVEQIQQLESIIGKNRICEVYGMTETAPVQTLNPPLRFKPGSVGIPLPGTDLRIVDPEDSEKEMPLGEVGEITVAGPQVMQGYLNAEEASKNALREHDGKRWMHTGDVGYLDDEGYVTVCDRSKDMLIVGGFKVFSVEVENKLQALPFVAMSAVVGRPDTNKPGNDVVQLYIQSPPGTTLSEEERKQEVETFCRANLAPYKVPKEVFFVDEIPLTSVGKIDKKALRNKN